MFKCFFVANNPDRIELLVNEGVKEILVSYAYARKAKGYLEQMKVARKKGVTLLVDSGAHTNIANPGSVVLKDYIAWLKEYKSLANEYIVLDDPLKRKNTLKSMEIMLDAGLSPIAVDHLWFKVAPEIMPWYKKGGRLCWAGFLTGNKTPMGDWAGTTKKMPPNYSTQFQTTAQWLAIVKRMLQRYPHVKNPPVNKLHLLGVGSKIKKFLPFMSCVASFDAASAFIAAGYGRVTVCRDPKQDGLPPRCSGIPVGRGRAAPDDVKSKAAKWKLNLDNELDRRKFNIREMRKYYEELWDYYETYKDKGHDFLLAASIKKSEAEDETLYPSVEFSPAVADIAASEWGERIQLDAMDAKALLAQQDSAAEIVGEIEVEDGRITKQVWCNAGKEELDETSCRVIKLCPVEKADEDKHIVFGVVLEPDTTDAQGDTIDSQEIERAAHLWLARHQDRGFMHEKIINSKIEIYESYIAPKDLTIGGQKVKHGTWLLMYHVLDDDLWKSIKSGKITGFSMGGFARRVAA